MQECVHIELRHMLEGLTQTWNARLPIPIHARIVNYIDFSALPHKIPAIRYDQAVSKPVEDQIDAVRSRQLNHM